jgi:hypothetical protein
MEALAATVISLVAPYLAKGAEEFAKEAGKEAFVKALVNRLQAWWTSDTVAEALIGTSALLGHRYPRFWTKHERARLAGRPLCL